MNCTEPCYSVPQTTNTALTIQTRGRGVARIAVFVGVFVLASMVLPSAAASPPEGPVTTTEALPFVQPSHFDYLLSYSLPGVQGVKVKNIPYVTKPSANGGPDDVLTMDVYYPPHHFAGSSRNAGTPSCKGNDLMARRSSAAPVLIDVMGYSDDAATQLFGTVLKDARPHGSFGRLAAAAGFVAITYQTTDADDLGRVVDFVTSHAEELHVDASNIGLLAVSANNVAGLVYAMPNHALLKFSVHLSALMVSPDRFLQDEVDSFGDLLGFYTGEIDAIATDLPMLIVRGGKDFPLLLATVDHFIEQAKAAGANLQVIDYPDGVHGWAVQIQDEESATHVAEVVNFMRTSVGLCPIGPLIGNVLN